MKNERMKSEKYNIPKLLDEGSLEKSEEVKVTLIFHFSLFHFTTSLREFILY